MSLRRTKTTQNCYANTELDFIITKNIIKIVAPFKVWRKTHIHKFNCFILCLNIFPLYPMPKSQIWKKLDSSRTTKIWIIFQFSKPIIIWNTTIFALGAHGIRNASKIDNKPKPETPISIRPHAMYKNYEVCYKYGNQFCWSVVI